MTDLPSATDTSNTTPFDGQIVVINGATGALGGAMARALQVRGAQLVLFGRRLDKLTALSDELATISGPSGTMREPIIQPVDFSGAAPEDYAQLTDALTEALGHIDILIHAMGMAGEASPLGHADLMKFQESLHVNLTAPFALTRALWPLLEAAEAGQVLFFTDRGTQAYGNAYTLAHAALTRMVEQWANESTKVRINGFDPGPTDSAMRKYRFPGELPEERAKPEDMLPEALALLADTSATGRIVRLQPGRN